MGQKNGSSQKDSTLVRDTFNFLQGENIDVSLEHLKNLIQNAPFVKELFIKITDTTEKSSQNVFDVIKKVTSIYEDELKREDLTYDQRMNIYNRIDQHAINAMKQDDSNKRFIAGVAGVLITSAVGGAIKFGPKIIKSVIKK
ncbi:hypothetical protein ACLIBG_10675 [Virgibacillus sp. W0181]|uniref:hypothetical protein n=1 Tax=Virgibacillus sp. W0181 TaxID=3391581 RepID=UPI003F484D2B